MTNKERCAAYYSAHREACNQRSREYNISHRAKMAEAQKAYYLAHKEEFQSYHKQYRELHKEELKAKRAAYAEQNKEKIAARLAATRDTRLSKKRIYNRKNREKRRAYSKLYNELNRERLNRKSAEYHRAHPIVKRLSESKRRAIINLAPIGDVQAIQAWESKWRTKVKVKCYWCQKFFPVSKCHADHIFPISRQGSHAVENMCISCLRCNSSKNNKLPSEWNAEIKEPTLAI